jgi:DDE superfamily endonuclease/Homeodomain-like domain
MAGRLRLPVRNCSCAAASPYRSRSPRVIGPSSRRSPGADRSPSTRSSTLASSSRSPKANGFKTSLPGCGALRPPSGASVVVTSEVASTASSPTGLAAGAPRRFPPLQRARIVELACLEPVAEGLHITHWSSADLARQAIADGIVPSISPATVRRILNEVHLQPHRTRYWRTSRLDERFKDRAEKVLWSYGNARRLARAGTWTVAVDEVPNFQVLERRPIRRAKPGSIEQREFEYIRHGTVNLLLFLIVHSGRMELAVLESKDAAHYIEQLRHFRRRHRRLAGVFLIQDGDPSHTAGETADYWASCGTWWRPRFTPAHASWLNEAELLVRAFGHRYLRRASWNSRQQFIDHVVASCPEYNELYAHPFQWTWSTQKMRRWFDKHKP